MLQQQLDAEAGEGGGRGDAGGFGGCAVLAHCGLGFWGAGRARCKSGVASAAERRQRKRIGGGHSQHSPCMDYSLWLCTSAECDERGKEGRRFVKGESPCLRIGDLLLVVHHNSNPTKCGGLAWFIADSQARNPRPPQEERWVCLLTAKQSTPPRDTYLQIQCIHNLLVMCPLKQLVRQLLGRQHRHRRRRVTPDYPRAPGDPAGAATAACALRLLLLLLRLLGLARLLGGGGGGGPT